jgi:hypothetical protein
MNPAIVDDDCMVYLGVATPKGAANYEITRYFTDSQVRQMGPLLEGLPLHINHETETVSGKKTPPSGVVLKAGVHPQTGALWTLFMPFPGKNGALARRLLGEDGVLDDSTKMSQLSLGFDIQELGGIIPVGHQIKELSICYEACRPGCEIKGKFPLSEFKKIPSATLDTYITNICGDINNIKNKSPLLEEEEMFQKLSAGPPVQMERPVGGVPMQNGQQQLQQSSVAVAGGGGGEQQQTTSTIQTKASASIPTAAGGVAMEEDTTTPNSSSSSSPMASIMLEPTPSSLLSQQGIDLMNSLTGDKRQRGGESPPAAATSSSVAPHINLQKHVVSDKPFMEVQPPAGLTEDALLMWKQQQEQLRKIYDENVHFKQEIKKQRIARLQGAANEVIPTLIGMIPDLNVTELEQFLANMDSISPVMDTAMTALIEAQASSQTATKKTKEDINTLQKKFKEENSELKKKLEDAMKRIMDMEEYQRKETTRPPQVYKSPQNMPPPPPPPVAAAAPNSSSSYTGAAIPNNMMAPPQLDRLSSIFAQAARKATPANEMVLPESSMIELAIQRARLFSKPSY